MNRFVACRRSGSPRWRAPRAEASGADSDHQPSAVPRGVGPGCSNLRTTIVTADTDATAVMLQSLDPGFELGKHRDHVRVGCVASAQLGKSSVRAAAVHAHAFDQRAAAVAIISAVGLGPRLASEMIAAVAVVDERAHVGGKLAPRDVRGADCRWRTCADKGCDCIGRRTCQLRGRASRRRAAG